MPETTCRCGHEWRSHYDAQFCVECGADCAVMPEPTPEQGRVETREEWRNVYLDLEGREFYGIAHPTREPCDTKTRFRLWSQSRERIAVERIATTTTVTRIPLAGQEEG